jgi:hypothetical protein
MIRKRPLHILADRLGRWRVQREGDDQALSQHDNETEAELAATEDEGTTEVIVHDRYERLHRASGSAPAHDT